MGQPHVTVVIVNHNGRDFLERLLPMLRATDDPAFDVCVVDNASSDESAVWIRAHHPAVHVLPRPRNDGFAAANEGIRLTRADAVALLNPDTRVPPEWLHRLVDAAFQDSATGIAAGIPLQTRQWNDP